jgi:hypothetical protein
MKYALYLLLPIIFLSCSKPNDSIQNETVPEPPAYIGVYNQVNGDTAYVSQTSTTGMVKIRWASLGTAAKIMFDSVRVAADNSFTVNQKVEYFGTVPAIGSGSFGNNTIAFHFVIESNGHIVFSGIKSN